MHGARGDTERTHEKFTIPLFVVRSARRIMREGHGGCPRLPPRRCTDAAPHREQGHPGGRTREEKRRKKEYARGDVHENRAECLFSLLKPYLRVFRGVSKCNLPGYVGFFQFLRNFRQQNAFEQAGLILRAALDPTIAHKARRGEFVKYLDHFDLLQSARN